MMCKNYPAILHQTHNEMLVEAQSYHHVVESLFARYPDFAIAKNGITNISFSRRTVIIDIENILLKQVWVKNEMEVTLAKKILS